MKIYKITGASEYLALSTLMDEYLCQNGFDAHYDAAAEVLNSRERGGNTPKQLSILPSLNANEKLVKELKDGTNTFSK